MAHPLIPKFVAYMGKEVKVVLRGMSEPIRDCVVDSVNGETGLIELKHTDETPAPNATFLITDVLVIIGTL